MKAENIVLGLFWFVTILIVALAYYVGVATSVQAQRFDSSISVPELTAFKNNLSDVDLYSIKYDVFNRGIIFNHSDSNLPVKIVWNNGASKIGVAVTTINKYVSKPLTQVNATYYTGTLTYENGEVQIFRMYVVGSGLIFEFPHFTSVCLNCASSMFTQTWNNNQTNSTVNVLAKTLNGSVMTSSTISIQDAKSCSTLTNLRGCINTSGLVGYWYMDETTDTLVQDFSGYGNNGTWNGNTTLNSTTGKINSGLKFDGVNDYVNAGNGESINITGAITIEAWIKIKNTNGAFIVSKVATNGGSYNPYDFRTDAGATPKLVLVRANSTTPELKNSTGTIPINVFSHVSVTVDSSKNYVFYINGVSSGSGSFVLTATSDASDLKIGSRGTAAANLFNGTIDEVRIYNRSLSAEEIRQDYLVSVQQMQAKYGENSTWSGYLNGTSNTSLPYAAGESYTNISWQVPDNVTDASGNTCYNCSQQMQFKPTLTVQGSENGSIDITRLDGYQYENSTWIPGQFWNTTWYNYTVADYSDLVTGAAVLLSNNATAVLQSSNVTFRAINLSNVTQGGLIYLNVTVPYNNAPLASASNGTFGVDENVIPFCSYSDPENNALNISATLNGVTQYGSCGNFGLLSAGSYTYKIWVNETSNTVAPLQNTSATSTITVQCNNCSLSGVVNNTLGAPVEWVKLTWNSNVVYSNSSGFYEFTNLSSGTHTLLARQVGYTDYSESFNLGANTTKNVTLSEKETVSEDTVIDYSLVGAIIGGLLAFVLLRKRRTDEYKYKRE